MPHFYFHLWSGGQLTLGEVGLPLLNFDAAKRRAESMASSIIGQSEGAPGILSSWTSRSLTTEAGRCSSRRLTICRTWSGNKPLKEGGPKSVCLAA